MDLQHNEHNEFSVVRSACGRRRANAGPTGRLRAPRPGDGRTGTRRLVHRRATPRGRRMGVRVQPHGMVSELVQRSRGLAEFTHALDAWRQGNAAQADHVLARLLPGGGSPTSDSGTGFVTPDLVHLFWGHTLEDIAVTDPKNIRRSTLDAARAECLAIPDSSPTRLRARLSLATNNWQTIPPSHGWAASKPRSTWPRWRTAVSAPGLWPTTARSAGPCGGFAALSAPRAAGALRRHRIGCRVRPRTSTRSAKCLARSSGHPLTPLIPRSPGRARDTARSTVNAVNIGRRRRPGRAVRWGSGISMSVSRRLRDRRGRGEQPLVAQHRPEHIDPAAGQRE